MCLSCLFLSSLVLSCLVLSCLVLPCLALPCLVLSFLSWLYLALSCLALPALLALPFPFLPFPLPFPYLIFFLPDSAFGSPCIVDLQPTLPAHLIYIYIVLLNETWYLLEGIHHVERLACLRLMVLVFLGHNYEESASQCCCAHGLAMRT